MTIKRNLNETEETDTITLKFENFRYICKHFAIGFDENHQAEFTCRRKDMIPQGDSWGICDSAHCPYAKFKMPTSKPYHEPYKPICPKGYTDCINDPAYIKYYYPDWYTEMYRDKAPEEVAITNCSNKRCFYDNEDK